MKAKQAVAWIKKCGIAVESARASVPSLAHLVAGEPIRGSWWAHPKGNDIFLLSRVIRSSPDVLVCRLVDGKITYVHRRMWPEIVLNGEGVTVADLSQFTEPNKRPDGSAHKFDVAYKDHPRRGYIGLQDHGSPCWFKNIKLKPMHAEKTNGVSP